MKDPHWHKHFIICRRITDQYDRTVLVFFEEVWRRWVPNHGWEYDLID